MTALRRPPTLTPAALVALATAHAHSYSDDPKRKVGCVLVDEDGWLIGLGSNRVKAAVADVLTEFPYLLHHPVKNILIQHAEASAIEDAMVQARARSESPKSLVAAVNYFPCERCARGLLVAGVKHVVSPKPDFSHHRWGREWLSVCALFERADVVVTYTEAAESVPPLPARRPTQATIKAIAAEIVDRNYAEAERDLSLDPDEGIRLEFAQLEAESGIGITWTPDDEDSMAANVKKTTHENPGTKH